jgi:heterodisulfide reductase subunit A
VTDHAADVAARRGSDDPVASPAPNTVLVIGSGPAGMAAALTLAHLGRPVILVERNHAVGGFFPLLDRTFPTDSCGVCFLSPTPPARCPIHECSLHEGIRLLTGASVEALEGVAGDFTARVSLAPRHIDPERCTLCGRCLEVCPVEVPAEFGLGVEMRRAVHRPVPQAIPRTPVIDMASCTRCGRCVEACPAGAVDLDEKARTMTVGAGAVVMGSGFEAVPATVRRELGWGVHRNVLTAIQFERLLSFSGPAGGVPVRPSDGRPLRRVAFIQCVGAREPAFGRGRCSTICCMYALKQASLAARRIPGLEPHFFHMDLRPMGKDYEEYALKAIRESGLRMRRQSLAGIKEDPVTRDLLLLGVDEMGRLTEERFDAAILATGFLPSADGRRLAESLGIPLDSCGYGSAGEFDPVRSGRDGIFMAGGFRGPCDVPDAALEGSAAAAASSASLGRLGPAIPGEVPTEGKLADGPRVGLFLCDCGGTLALDAVRESFPGRHRDLVHVESLSRACDPEGITLMLSRLAERGFNRVVVAGCSRPEFRRDVRDRAAGAGFNPHLIEFADLREGCFMVHQGEGAVRKAVALVSMAVERARRVVPLSEETRSPNRRVLVVGAGAAGMTAALALDGLGFPVTLLEREEETGGLLRQASQTIRGSEPRALVADLRHRVDEAPGIELVTRARATESRGQWGAFRTTVVAGGVTRLIEHGAVILAVGGRESVPRGFSYGHDPRVITQKGLERELEEGRIGPGTLGSVVMIQCAGSRDEEHPWCSRLCCTQAVKNALRLKQLDPSLEVRILHRDVRTFGAYEEYYLEARRRGVLFMRYEENALPSVGHDDDRLTVSLFDATLGRVVCLKADRVVASGGVLPGSDVAECASVFGMELDRNGFMREANPKSAPVDAVDRGKYFCGLCRGPAFIEDALLQAQAAAGRAAALLSGAAPALRIRPARVVERLCSGCGLCVAACPYRARTIDGSLRALVSDSICRGCGLCAAVCPNGATRHVNFQTELTMAVIDAAID